MNQTTLVAVREFRERTRRKGFWALLVLSALAVVAVVVVPGLVSGPDVVHVGVAGPEPRSTVGTLRGAARGAGVEIRVSVLRDDAALERQIKDGTLDAGVDTAGRIVVRTALQAGDVGGTARLVAGVRSSLRLQRGLDESGLDAEGVRAVLEAKPPAVRSLEQVEEGRSARQGTAMVANIVLFVLLQVYGAWVLTGVTEEKSGRVAEVLLAVITPRSLLTGKVIGIGLAALLHAVLLVAAGVVAGAVTGASFLDQLDPAALPAAIVWLMLGYTFYCFVLGAAGSTVSRAEDAQNMAFPILLPVMIVYLVSFGVIFSDGVPLFYRVLAWLPPTSPVAMSVLQLSGRVSWWEAVASAFVCFGGIVGVSRLAGRVYEGSILRVGQRVKVRAALRSREMS